MTNEGKTRLVMKKVGKPRGKPFEKGKPGGPGRPRGCKNKISRDVKTAILAACEIAGGRRGMAGYLEQQAREQPVAFLSLLGRIVPREVVAQVQITQLQDLVTRSMERAGLGLS